MHLVLIETVSNQPFIFGTNKLRENVGASELVLQVGTQFVSDAIAELGGTGLQPIHLASGKALLMVEDPTEHGEQLIGRVTRRALEEAPGLGVLGVVGEAFDLDRDPVHERVRDVHLQHEALRSRLPGPESRFPRLPFVAECATSGLPASALGYIGPESAEMSALTLAKRQISKAAFDRIREKTSLEGWPSIGSVADLDTIFADRGDTAWLAVVHADGNGIGQVFQAFDQHAGEVGAACNRSYITKLKAFSDALDRVTEAAFRQALEEVARFVRARDITNPLPVLPLIMGGDDLTVIMDGRLALPFTVEFLRAFEDQSAVVAEWTDLDRLTASAGVAVIKPHFPFAVAYDLAEDLCRSAKQVKQHVPGGNGLAAASAIDYHVLYDSSVQDLDRIRARLSLMENGQPVTLHAKPYVVSDIDRVRALGAEPAAVRWATERRWCTVMDKVQVLRQRDEEGRRRVPRHLLHELRKAMRSGASAADARFGLALPRYRGTGLERLAAQSTPAASLFRASGGQRVADLLDAMEAEEILPIGYAPSECGEKS